MTSDPDSPPTLNSGTAWQLSHTVQIVAGVVLFSLLMSCYGFLVQSQVKRGEAFREAQRAGLSVVRVGSLLRPAGAPSSQEVPRLAGTSPR